MQQEVHQSSTNHPSKTSHQNLQAHQDIIIDTADKGGKIVIMNRNEYKEECKKQISDSTFYEQTWIQSTKIKHKVKKQNHEP